MKSEKKKRGERKDRNGKKHRREKRPKGNATSSNTKGEEETEDEAMQATEFGSPEHTSESVDVEVAMSSVASSSSML